MSAPLPPSNGNGGPPTPTGSGATGDTTSTRRHRGAFIAGGGACVLAAVGLLGAIAIGMDQPDAPAVSPTPITATASAVTTTSTPAPTTTTPSLLTTAPSGDTGAVQPTGVDIQTDIHSPPPPETPVLPSVPETTLPQTTFQPEPSIPAMAPFRSCAAARAAGAAPLYRGDPGYSSALDRDGDGVACESGG